MDAATVILAVTNTVQLVALAWIAAWQQRAALEVRRLNGSVVESIQALADPQPPAARPSPRR